MPIISSTLRGKDIRPLRTLSEDVYQILGHFSDLESLHFQKTGLLTKFSKRWDEGNLRKLLALMKRVHRIEKLDEGAIEEYDRKISTSITALGEVEHTGIGQFGKHHLLILKSTLEPLRKNIRAQLEFFRRTEGKIMLEKMHLSELTALVSEEASILRMESKEITSLRASLLDAEKSSGRAVFEDLWMKVFECNLTLGNLLREREQLVIESTPDFSRVRFPKRIYHLNNLILANLFRLKQHLETLIRFLDSKKRRKIAIFQEIRDSLDLMLSQLFGTRYLTSGRMFIESIKEKQWGKLWSGSGGFIPSLRAARSSIIDILERENKVLDETAQMHEGMKTIPDRSPQKIELMRQRLEILAQKFGNLEGDLFDIVQNMDLAFSARAFGKLILAPAIGVKIRFKLIGSLANRGTPEVIRQLVGNAYAPFSFLKQRRFGEAAKVNVWLLAGLSGLTLLAYLLKLLMTGVPESHEAGDHTTGLIDDLEATQGQLEEDAAKVNNAANLSEIGTLIDEADRIRESGETTPPSASPLEAPSEHPESPIGIAALISPYEAEAIARLLNDSTNEDGKIFSKVELFKAGDKNLPLFIFLSDTHHGSFESVVDSIWGKMGQASNQEEFLDALNNFGQNLEDSSEEDLVEINEALRIAKPGFLGCEGWAGKASSQILNGEKEVLEKFLGNEVEGVVPSEVNEIQRIRQQGGFPLIGLEEEEIQEAALINEAEKFHIIQSYASVFLKAMIFHAAPGTDFSDEKSQVLKMRNMVISQIADLKPEHATAPSWEETKQFLEGEGLGRIGRISPRLGSFFESELKKIAEFEQELTQQRERAIQLNNSAKKENEVAKKAQENLQSLRQKAEEARADLERAKGAFENHRGERSIPDEIKRYERFNKIKKEITKISDAVNKGGPEQFAQEGLKIVEEIKRLAREKNEITGTGRSARNIRESIEENITDTKVIGEALRLMFADIEEFNQAKSRVSRVLRQEKEAREEDNAHKRHIEGKRRDWQKELAEARQKTQDISKAAEAHFDAMQEPMEEIADELTVGRRDDIVAKKLLDGMSNSPRKVSLVFFGDDHIQSIIGKLRGQMECHVIVLDDKEDEGGETAPSQRPGNNMHEGTPPAGRNTTPANNIQEAASSSTIPPQSPQHTGIPASEAEKQTGPGAEIARKLNVSGEDISLGQKDPIEARLLRGEIVPGKELAQAYVQKEVEEFLEVRKAETKAGLMFKWRLASKTAERIYSHINGLTPQEIEKRFLNGADVDDRLMPLIKTTLVFNALLKNDGGQLQYLKNAGNIGDTLTTGRFQCQSGTDLFLCLAFHLLEEGELKDFVDVALIQKDGIGHEKPGMIINNSLITMEITSAGINICYDGNLRALGGPIVITKAVEGMVDKMDKIYNPALKSIRLIRGMKPYSPLASPPPGFKFPKSLPDIYWPGEQGEVIVPEQQPDELKELNKEYEAECRKIMETLKRKQDLAEGIFTVDIKQDFEPEAGEDAKKAPELDWKAALEELSKVKDDETLLSNMALSLTRDGKVMPLGPGTNITIPEGGLQGNEGGESGAQPSSGQQEGIRNWGKDIKKIYEETKDDPNLTGFKQYYGNKPGCPHGFTYGGFLNDPDAPRDTQGNIKTPDNPGQTISVFFHRHWYEEKETLGVKLDFYLDGKFIESKYTLLNAIKIDGRSEDAFFIKDGKKIEFKVETKRLQ